ncbi:unnamed protein product [Pieris macdunnoughi]|uniref:Uncharacterized protein n=1 Tax=Pieris macdunnoughi TaxID=345717 RepID=A0A821VZC0_9NEOP|nr:unnamed protein product [Pieris macdunnoughi]
MEIFIWYSLLVFGLTLFQEVPCQFHPGLMPARTDDDLGLILTVLLLARQRNSNMNNCNRQRKTIPIPYPVPFTTTPIIRSRDRDDRTGSNEETSQEDSKSFDLKYNPVIVAESEETTN